MPFSAITKNVAFSHGPHAGSTVAVHFPENFNPAGPFALCVFIHGLSGDTPYSGHLVTLRSDRPDQDENAPY